MENNQNILSLQPPTTILFEGVKKSLFFLCDVVFLLCAPDPITDFLGIFLGKLAFSKAIRSSSQQDGPQKPATCGCFQKIVVPPNHPFILVGFSIVVPLFLETPMFVGSRIFVQDKPTCLQAAWLGLHVLHLLGILRHDMIPFLPQSWFSAKLPKIPKGKLYLGDDPSFHWTMISKKLGS